MWPKTLGVMGDTQRREHSVPQRGHSGVQGICTSTQLQAVAGANQFVLTCIVTQIYFNF